MSLTPLSQDSCAALRALLTELLAVDPDYIGPLQTACGRQLLALEDSETGERENDLSLVIAELARLAKEMTGYRMTVKRAHSELVDAECPPQVVLVLCPGGSQSPTDSYDSVFDYLVGMRLFSYQRPEIFAAASAQTVRDRREWLAASYRFSEYVADAQCIVLPWLMTEGSHESAQRALLKDLLGKINTAMATAGGTAKLDVPMLLDRLAEAAKEDSLSSQLVFAHAAAISLGLLPRR